MYELSSGMEKAKRKCPFTLTCHGSQAASREWLGDSFKASKKGLPVAVKLPWDIIDAKSSHADRGVWTYPLKKTLPKAIVHEKKQFWFRESPHQ